MMLSSEEKERYSRHILLSEVGEKGQEELKSAKVLVIGAGGLSCPALQYLTAAGVGKIGVIDFDVVDESNLQRQILFSVDDIGKNKAQQAIERLRKLNPFIEFDCYPEKLTPQNAIRIFESYDIVLDGSDNFSTRYMVNDACIILRKPLVYAAIHKFEGQVSVFNYQGGPSYRCLFPTPPEVGTVQNCSEVGVLGVLPGIIGAMQANEVVKIILGIGKVLSGKLSIINILLNTSYVLDIAKNQDEIDAVLANKEIFPVTDYDFFCGVKTHQNEEIAVDELKAIIGKESLTIIDVREFYETPKVEELNALNIPLGELEEAEIITEKPIVVFCQHGIRSQKAAEILKKKGFPNVRSLKGGIVTW